MPHLQPKLLQLITLLTAVPITVARGEEAGFGLSLGSTAAAKLLEHYVHQSLRQPRQLQMELNSGLNPWFNPIAHVESKNRIQLGGLEIHFRGQRVEAEWHNVTLHSDSNIHLLPLPYFLDANTAHLLAHVPRALLQLRVVGVEHGGWGLDVEECDMGVDEMHIHIDRAYLINQIINPLHRLLMPRSLIHKTACDLLGNAVEKLRRRFALEIPLASLVPEKFVSALQSPNTSLFSQLQSITADQDQLTVSATVEWTENGELAASDLINSTSRHQSVLTVDVPVVAQNSTQNGEAEFQSTTHASVAAGNISSTEERSELWVEDRVINELLGRFRWEQEWIDERIPMESSKLPQSTSAFLSALCSNCYFVLRVRGTGPPTVHTWSNGSLVLRKSDQIHMKVVNPSRNVDAVFANFNLALGVRLTPQVEAGVFRTQVDLLEIDIRMEEGAFPAGWKDFIQDLVRGMIMDVIWPGLKREIESLTWSDGVAISSQCGVDPNSVRLYFRDGRLGASAALHLEEISVAHCVQQMKSKLPDPAKLFVLREN